MSIWGTAEPKPGTGAQLGYEARQTANDIRADLDHVKGSKEAADQLDKIADDLESADNGETP